MNESEETPPTSISQARTLDEIAQFWETHSLADYWDQTREVEFEVRAKRRRRITLDPAVYARVEAQARVRGILPETLVHLWLVEQLQKLGAAGEQGGKQGAAYPLTEADGGDSGGL